VDNRLFYQLHQKKIGTPAMGGLLMLLATSVLAAVLYPTTATWIFLLAFVSFSALGLLDDVSKALVKAGLRKDDFAAMPKFVAQWGMAFVVGGLLYWLLGRHTLSLPFVGALDISVGYVALAALVLATTANAANIADGLDGLAGGMAVIVLSAFAVIAAMRGQPEALGWSAILAGSVLGFLLFNVHPAKVFMGDVGSMGIGVGMAMAGLMTDALVPLLVIAGVFAVELLSSLIQTAALRRGRKVFRIAPLHHHLEAVGWPETRITQTFWVISAVLAFAGILISLA
jgi:phospho-N-acetylmuramoyl-pentapeptide-transferase